MVIENGSWVAVLLACNALAASMEQREPDIYVDAVMGWILCL